MSVGTTRRDFEHEVMSCVFTLTHQHLPQSSIWPCIAITADRVCSEGLPRNPEGCATLGSAKFRKSVGIYIV